VNEIKVSKGMKGDEVVYLTPDNIKKTPEGMVMDELRLRKMCCRRHMLTHIDIM
jgi:DNA-directed RNA polymerase I, II, and III subunit RPABC5